MGKGLTKLFWMRIQVSVPENMYQLCSQAILLILKYDQTYNYLMGNAQVLAS